MPTVFVPAPLRRHTGGQSRLEVPGRTVREVLQALTRAYPEVGAQVLDASGEVRTYINIFVNGTEIRTQAGQETPVGEGDEVSIIPAMAGGARTTRAPTPDAARAATPRREAIADTVLDLIGHTPLVRLHKVVRGVRAEVLAKLEFLNPGGSVKDRIGIRMIRQAEQEGKLRPGGVIVEATSGNTGVALAMAAAVRGYRCVFVMPDKMSEEKIRLLRAFGARVVITPTAVPPDDPRSYYSVSRRLAQELPNAFYADQYHNPANPAAHYETTGPELWEQTGGRLDVLVVGLGTGGTASGAARYLKERHPGLVCVGVDPVGSIYTEYFRTGRLPEPHTYKVEGIGEDFLPGTMDFSVVDEVVPVTDREAFTMTRRLVREEGLLCGGSSGAAVAGALKYLRGLPDHGEGRRVVVILPDSGLRYLSKIFSDDWMREHGFLEADLGTVSELLGAKGLALITAGPADPVRAVIAKMKEFDVSQLPVVADGQLVGMISEVDLLSYLLEGGHGPDDPITPIVDPAPPVVSPDTPVDDLAEVFLNANAAVVVDRGRVVGIVTKIDVIDHLARKLGR
ncbi:MAG: cystathionine beta-synthase [Armatimonadota bacterium]|nr:cystathionine beta-synthase [Armatimonadota bacterium]MDR7448311.1 cystathionine beta-synthase [Armatimonadota bacterium]MDR7459271.1 cystathionine beta-synthase [Armatimonadota bacterium]MDR7478357.1 cystathionine beta-synthase [Armatimonadota bacterium]MDR7487200.1 cystathionine beta-synthase [Armatimonadota bacterium]